MAAAPVTPVELAAKQAVDEHAIILGRSIA